MLPYLPITNTSKTSSEMFDLVRHLNVSQFAATQKKSHTSWCFYHHDCSSAVTPQFNSFKYQSSLQEVEMWSQLLMQIPSFANFHQSSELLHKSDRCPKCFLHYFFWLISATQLHFCKSPEPPNLTSCFTMSLKAEPARWRHVWC